MFETRRTNVILYCHHWQGTVQFYRKTLQAAVSFENDWFIEFQLAECSFLSIANAARATIDDAQGQGITLSWQVENLMQLKYKLEADGVPTTDIRAKWNAESFYCHDPEGHRIEFWHANPNQVPTACDLATSVPDWVIAHPTLLNLFQEHGIDYCCAGKSLKSACLELRLEPTTVLDRIHDLLRMNHGER